MSDATERCRCELEPTSGERIYTCDQHRTPREVTLPDQDAHETMQEKRAAAFANRFPNKVGVVSTHYDDCYHGHSTCAWHLGFDDGAEATQHRIQDGIEAIKANAEYVLIDDLIDLIVGER